MEQKKQALQSKIQKDLAHIAAFFHTTHGMPLEVFKESLSTHCPTIKDEVEFILKFKQLHPHGTS